MSKIFNKIKFILKRPKVVIVTGEGRACAAEAIRKVLRQNKNKILIIEAEFQKVDDLEFLVKKSSLPILVVTHIGDIPFDKDSNPPTTLPLSAGPFFAGPKEKTKEIIKLAKILPTQGFLILNFDDETVREIKDYNPPTTHIYTFGFQEGADFRATDVKYRASEGSEGEDENEVFSAYQASEGSMNIRSSPASLLLSEGGKEGKALFDLNTGINFKINYKGNIVPIWLEKLFGKEQIYSALSAAGVGVIFDLNLVEISQSLKNYQSLPGKMRLIKGRNHSWILDDSESASVSSMVEAIEILGKVQGPEFHRRIAVLGDVLGVGKYTIEAHETIGEKVYRAADLLFTFGLRAKFVAQGAESKGMALEKIFQFDIIDDGKIRLQDEIKEGDLILVDGSKEMEMGKLVREIKAP